MKLFNILLTAYLITPFVVKADLYAVEHSNFEPKINTSGVPVAFCSFYNPRGDLLLQKEVVIHKQFYEIVVIDTTLPIDVDREVLYIGCDEDF